MKRNLLLQFKTTLAVMCCMYSVNSSAVDIEWYDGSTSVTYNVQKSVDPVVLTALDMFGSDMQAVTGRRARPVSVDGASIRIIEADRASGSVLRRLKKEGVPVDSLMTLTDGFHISVIGRQITVVGANGRGTAYGVLELSRMAGVSPWIWWGDVLPERRNRLIIDVAGCVGGISRHIH